MFYPIEGGSSVKVGFDNEWIECQLPPVGYVINKMPDPETGKPKNTLEKREILFDDLPIPDQKWKRTPLPDNWKKLRAHEIVKQKINPDYYDPELEEFREEMWDRRINGRWIAIGNRSGKPSEYVYLPGSAWFYFNCMDFGFTNTDGYPLFRFTYLKVFYAKEWARENPACYGVTLSTLRRYGKTAMIGEHLLEEPLRRFNYKGGLQAQNDKAAGEKFEEVVVYPWRRLWDFFRPAYDYKSQQAKEIRCTLPPPQSEKAIMEYDPDKDPSIHSVIDYRKTSAFAYDKAKLHKYAIEEPGKIEGESVLKMWQQVKPAHREGPDIIGDAFIPTTVEEMDKGGKEFVDLFEQSFPSWADKLPNGQTKSGLIALFIPATDGYIFDEYGRSIIDDPAPDEKVYNEKGKRILKGALSEIMDEREGQKDDLDNYAQIIRKYPLSWSEAKMSSVANCIFNTKILMDVSEKIHNGQMPKGRRANLKPVDPKNPDGDIEIDWDEYGGRFTIYWLPDAIEKESRGTVKILNNYGVESVYENGKNKKEYYPKNDAYFAFGGDPIKFVKTDDPRASKHSFWMKKKRKLRKIFKDSEGNVINEDKQDNSIFDDNLILRYHYRPNDPKVAFEDILMACKLFGVSVLIEDNIGNQRQYLESRGHGRFVLYQEDLATPLFQENPKTEKGVDTNVVSLDLLVRKGIDHVNRKGHEYCDGLLVDQLLEFNIANRTKYDAVMGWMYCLLAEDMIVVEEEEATDVGEWFDEFSYDGTKPVLIEDVEENESDTSEWDFF